MKKRSQLAISSALALCLICLLYTSFRINRFPSFLLTRFFSSKIDCLIIRDDCERHFKNLAPWRKFSTATNLLQKVFKKDSGLPGFPAKIGL